MSKIILIFSLIILLTSCNKNLYITQINSLQIELENCKKNEKVFFNANAARYSNALFFGIENSIQITHNIKDSVFFEVDNGTIEKKGESVFLLKSESVGELNLIGYKKTVDGKKMVVNQNFRVMNLPPPIIKFDGKTLIKIPKEILINVKEFTCNQAPHFEYFLKYEIIELRFQVLRNDKIIIKWEQEGSLLTELTKQNKT